MTTLTYTTRTPDRPPADARALAGSAWLPGVRMLRGEFLKLARRRGLMIAAAVLTVGAVMAYLAVAEWLHVARPRLYGPAGGTHNLVNTDYILATFGAIVAVLLGASAGAADVTAGVFRNLVITGRSRAALFLARIPAGLVLTVAFVLAGYAVAVASSFLLAGGRPAPPASFLLGGGGWLVVNAGLAFLLGLGLSTLTGSQPITVAIMVGLNIVVMPVVASMHALPHLRELLPGVALDQLRPHALAEFSSPALIMPATKIAAVLIGWAALAVAAGTWRTVSRDA